MSVLTVFVPTLFQLVYIRYVSYHVDKEIYGNFILLQTLIVALSYIFLQIPSQAYDRFYNTVKDKVSYVNEFRTILVFINFLSFFVVLIYGFFMKKFSFGVLFTVFIYFVLLNSYSFNQKIFLLNLDRKKYFYLKTYEAFAKFVMPLVFYTFKPSLESFLTGIVAGYAVSFLFLKKFLAGYPFRWNVDLKNYKKYFLFAYPILFVAIFSWGISFTDRYFIEFLKSTEDVAVYALLAQVAGFGQIIGQIFGIYVNPKILRFYEKDKYKALQSLKKYLIKLAAIFILLSLVSFVIPRSIYEILLDKIILEDYYFYTFYILVIAIFLTVFQTALSLYLVLLKKLHILAYVNALAFIINILGNFFIKEYGIIAAAVSTALAYSVLNIGQVMYLRKALKKL